MRKGFILTLTALVTAFMVTSAVALGPTVGPVPDVYIGPAAASGAPAEIGVNMFRYSNALTLWDYVTPGVLSGDGSGSDTLYLAWGLKNADLSGGTGSYLDQTADPTSIHYSIIQESGIEALLLAPTKEVGDPGWEVDINNDLTAQGSALADYTVANAGQLTFRNIRLSPLPDQAAYGTPTADPGAPAGTLDVQEATLYVSDASTTAGTTKILLVTVPTGPDYLSGGPVWTPIQDYSSDTSGFAPFSLEGVISNSTIPSTIPAPSVTQSVTGGQLATTVPGTNTADRFNYAQFTATWPSASVDPANLYRITAMVTSSNASAASNPSFIIGLNARGNAGYSFTQILQGQGPDLSTGAQRYSGYLVPAEAGTPQPLFAIYDPAGSYGGTITASQVKVMSVEPLTDALAAATSGLFTSTFTVDASNWTYFDAFYAGYAKPTFAHTPSSGTASELVISATTPASGQQGFASFQGPTDQFSYTPGKLIIVGCTLATSSGASATLPTAWLNIEVPVQQPGFLIERDNAGTSGPTTTPKVYYLAFEGQAATTPTGKLNFRVIADKNNISGDIRLSQIAAVSLDLPAEP